MKIKILCLLISLFSWSMCAEAQGWQRNFDNLEQAGQVFSTPDGGAVFSAVKVMTGGARDIIVLKTDLDGKMQWQKTLGGSANDQNRSLMLTRSGDIVVCGLRSETGQNDAGFVSRLSIAGAVIWQKTWPFFSARAVAASTEQLDGTLIFAAETTSDVLLVKAKANIAPRGRQHLCGRCWSVHKLPLRPVMILIECTNRI